MSSINIGTSKHQCDTRLAFVPENRCMFIEISVEAFTEGLTLGRNLLEFYFCDSYYFLGIWNQRFDNLTNKLLISFRGLRALIVKDMYKN